MKRKRLANRESVHGDHRSHGVFRLCRWRCGSRTVAASCSGGIGLQTFAKSMAVLLLALPLSSCADYETDYEQSVQAYVNGEPRVEQQAEEADTAGEPTATTEESSEGP